MGTMAEEVAREQDEFDAAQVQTEEGGERSVDEISADEVQEPTPPMQIPLEGLGTGISASPGGDKPQTSSIALRGGKLSVAGEYKKGDVIELYVRARVGEVHFVDTLDKFGEVVGTDRRHIAKPIAVRRIASAEQ